MADDGSVELPNDDDNFDVVNMDSALLWRCDGDCSKPTADRQAQSQWLQPGPSYAYQPSDEAREHGGQTG